MTDQNPWRAIVADENGTIITDPDQIAAILVDESGRGTIGIRRSKPQPDPQGHHWDIFVDIDLVDIAVEDAADMWRLAQAAAKGMNADSATEAPR